MTPEIVVLCGSTRFRTELVAENRRLTLAGCMVLAPGVFQHDGDEITDEQKRDLDDLHLRKIDASSRVFVVNPDGYIGASTHREVAYATYTGKMIDYLFPLRANVANVVRTAIAHRLGTAVHSGILECRDSLTLANTVVLRVSNTFNATVAEQALHDAGYRTSDGPADGHGVVLLAQRATCMACPPGCGSCSGGYSDCECYQHQNAAPSLTGEGSTHA